MGTAPSLGTTPDEPAAIALLEAVASGALGKLLDAPVGRFTPGRLRYPRELLRRFESTCMDTIVR
ncbi:MAG: hypothetical protein ACYCS7_14610 [Acidimicrobiales bacterium]